MKPKRTFLGLHHCKLYALTFLLVMGCINSFAQTGSKAVKVTISLNQETSSRRAQRVHLRLVRRVAMDRFLSTIKPHLRTQQPTNQCFLPTD